MEISDDESGRMVGASVWLLFRLALLLFALRFALGVFQGFFGMEAWSLSWLSCQVLDGFIVLLVFYRIGHSQKWSPYLHSAIVWLITEGMGFAVGWLIFGATAIAPPSAVAFAVTGSLVLLGAMAGVRSRQTKTSG